MYKFIPMPDYLKVKPYANEVKKACDKLNLVLPANTDIDRRNQTIGEIVEVGSKHKEAFKEGDIVIYCMYAGLQQREDDISGELLPINLRDAGTQYTYIKPADIIAVRCKLKEE